MKKAVEKRLAGVTGNPAGGATTGTRRNRSRWSSRATSASG